MVLLNFVLLVSPGARVDCPDSDGNTPLHFALSHCEQKAITVREPTDVENAKSISEARSLFVLIALVVLPIYSLYN